MTDCSFYSAGITRAIHYASEILIQKGWKPISDPQKGADWLLLDVPSFDCDGKLRSGEHLSELLGRFRSRPGIIGGNIPSEIHPDITCVDLLADAQYLAENASITAHCALEVLLPKLPVILNNANILIIGWGRIGKCLASLLDKMGADVTVSVRNPSQKAILSALGFSSVFTKEINPSKYQVIINTVPALVLSKEELQNAENTVLLDLASKKGLDSDHTIWARGLPGKYAPKSSGILIAERILSLAGEVSA